MGQLAADAGRKVVAAAVLLVAAYVLFKLVLGFVSAIVWTALAIVAVFAIIWAVRTL